KGTQIDPERRRPGGQDGEPAAQPRTRIQDRPTPFRAGRPESDDRRDDERRQEYEVSDQPGGDAKERGTCRRDVERIRPRVRAFGDRTPPLSPAQPKKGRPGAALARRI